MMTYTFYEELAGTTGGAVMCGKGRKYQVNLSAMTLLSAPTEADAGYDKSLVALAERVNDVFSALGSEVLAAKRRELERAGVAGHDRLELTVLFTEKGIQPAFSIALARKERAPVPHKGLGRRLFGWLTPNRTEAWTVEQAPARKAPARRAATSRTKRQG